MRRAVVLVGVSLIFAIDCVSSPLTILYTNDLHLRFGRLTSIERRIAEERAGESPVLLFDAGDAWQDFRRPLPAVWGADQMVEWMNRADYDAMALGNHDMYWGAERLDDLARKASFPILCANLRPARGGVAPFAPSTRLAAGEVAVLAIGLITEELLPYSAYPTLRTAPAVAAVRDEIDRAANDTDLIVVVAHLPIADAVRVAEEVPEIDVFITGHSHEATEDPVRVGETLIVQSGGFGENVGRLAIDVDPATGGHRLIDNELIATQQAPTDIRRGVHQLFTVALGVLAAALLGLL
jgi:2',3'-cyclic-nucleotide 2'-phosphodiesterase (5'-nucleotidase family)